MTTHLKLVARLLLYGQLKTLKTCKTQKTFLKTLA